MIDYKTWDARHSKLPYYYEVSKGYENNGLLQITETCYFLNIEAARESFESYKRSLNSWNSFVQMEYIQPSNAKTHYNLGYEDYYEVIKAQVFLQNKWQDWHYS